MDKPVLVFLLLAVEASYGLPQGFFSQGLSLPRFVQSDSKLQSVELPFNIKLESPVKASLLNIFGKKNAKTTEKSRKEPASNEVKVMSDVEVKDGHSLIIDDSYSTVKSNKETNDKKINEESQKVMDFVVLKKEEELFSKSVTDNEISNTEATTEYITETTTDDYETTTFIDEPLNRSGASPALVASLLG